MRANRERGFTLVELLVVIGIIAILASIAFPVMASMKTRSKANATKMLIERLKLALDAYASSSFGDYPPSNPKLVGLPVTGTDDGIKTLVRCLSTKKNGGPFFQFDEESLKKDESGRVVKGNPTSSYFATGDLFTCVDAFGQPLIYLHNADYEKGQKVDLGTETPMVGGNRSKKVNQYHSFNKFQLWSVGANGRNDGGEEDDIASWSGSE